MENNHRIGPWVLIFDERKYFSIRIYQDAGIVGITEANALDLLQWLSERRERLLQLQAWKLAHPELAHPEQE